MSNEALCVLSSTVPIDILASERRRVYERRCDDRSFMVLVKQDERKSSIVSWQHRWNSSVVGRWTFRLIPDLEKWYERTHGEIDYYLCQILSGHGCFRAYLFKYKHDESQYCPSCIGTAETAEHVFFNCPQFIHTRNALSSVLCERVSPDTIVKKMLESKEIWNAVCTTAFIIMKELRRLERARHAIQPVPAVVEAE